MTTNNDIQQAGSRQRIEMSQVGHQPDAVSIALTNGQQVIVLDQTVEREKLLRYSDLARKQLHGTATSTFWIQPYYRMLFDLVTTVDEMPVLNADFGDLLRLYHTALTTHLDCKVGQELILDSISKQLDNVILSADDARYAWRSLRHAGQGWSSISCFAEELLNDILGGVI